MNTRIVRHDMFADASADAFLTLLGGLEDPAVGLATGNSPIPTYDELRQRVYAGRAELASVRPFAIDEYVGPHSHHCSNHSFFERYWAPIPGVQPVNEFDAGAPSLHSEASRFAAELEAAGGLDVVVLGIGMNGHLAFNEPGSQRDSVARVVELHAATRESASVCWAPDVPTHGLTLGLKELLAARRVLLLANGRKKAEIVRQALHGPVDAACPASFLQEHPGVTVVLDEAAARLLRG